VHGVLDRGRSFSHVAERLGGRCRLRWYDRRGYGASVGGSPVGVLEHIADAVAVLDGEPAVVVGHSFGGMTALGLAATAPALVEAVVVYETVVPWATGWGDETMRAVLADDDPAGAGLRLMIGDRLASMSEDELAERRVHAAAFVAEERSVRSGTPLYDVGAIRAPVVYGRSSQEFVLPVARYLAASVPRFEEVLLDGADHHAHRTDVDRFAALVERGLELRSGG
jgi:pimeloyl-ACP methyl ester carboxylesterase